MFENRGFEQDKQNLGILSDVPFLCGKAVCEFPDDVFMAKRQILAGLLEKNMVPEGWKPDPAQFLGTCCGSFRARAGMELSPQRVCPHYGALTVVVKAGA